jgi:hypothetical protein
MLAGYLLSSILAGAVAAIAMLLVGHPMLEALVVYSLCGATGMGLFSALCRAGGRRI